QVLASVIGIDERVQREPRDLIAAVFDVADGFIEQDFVRLQRVLRDRVLILLAAETARDQEARRGDEQNKTVNVFIQCHSIPYLYFQILTLGWPLPHEQSVAVPSQ